MSSEIKDIECLLDNSSFFDWLQRGLLLTKSEDLLLSTNTTSKYQQRIISNIKDMITKSKLLDPNLEISSFAIYSIILGNFLHQSVEINNQALNLFANERLVMKIVESMFNLYEKCGRPNPKYFQSELMYIMEVFSLNSLHCIETVDQMKTLLEKAYTWSFGEMI
jgi:hypothetical protein